MEATPDLFGTALNDIASGPHLGGHAAVTEALMRRLAEKGATLAHLAKPQMMNRSLRTLEAHCREFGLAFPDYVPMALRKRLVLQQRGDFYELRGEFVDEVAKSLQLAPTGKGEARMVGVPAHRIDECREALERAWYIVKLVHAKKKGRADG